MFVKVDFTHAQVQELHNWQPGNEVSHNDELHLIITYQTITGGFMRYTLERVEAVPDSLFLGWFKRSSR